VAIASVSAAPGLGRTARANRFDRAPLHAFEGGFVLAARGLAVVATGQAFVGQENG
jgi:hypothetical protein